MKYIIIAIVLLSGCAQMDGVYNTGKKLYVGGREVVIQNADMLPQETLDKLERIDDYTGRYNSARTVVREGKPQTATGE